LPTTLLIFCFSLMVDFIGNMVRINVISCETRIANLQPYRIVHGCRCMYLQWEFCLFLSAVRYYYRDRYNHRNFDRGGSSSNAHEDESKHEGMSTPCFFVGNSCTNSRASLSLVVAVRLSQASSKTGGMIRTRWNSIRRPPEK
jgi:hypothetical protein